MSTIRSTACEFVMKRHRASAAPSFRKLRPSSALASHVLSRVRKSGTKCELLLAKELWRRGLRYRKHPRKPIGSPDFVFAAARVVVFCDGDFWHGRNWMARKRRLAGGANGHYWVAKIHSNIARDKRTSRALTAAGYVVMRFWESDILRDVREVASVVELVVRTRKAVSTVESDRL